MVAFVPTDTEAEESWSAPGDVTALAAEYAGWDKRVEDTIQALDETFRWGIYDRAPLARWSTKRVTLLGDAAHPMVPHIGQGSGQAIEDGFTLAAVLADATSSDIADRLRLYEDLRRERTSKVQALARAAGKLYRSEDVPAADRAIRLREWMAQGTWIYQFDAAKVAADAAARLRR
jgi:salicylate hydroxylase